MKLNYLWRVLCVLYVFPTLRLTKKCSDSCMHRLLAISKRHGSDELLVKTKVHRTSTAEECPGSGTHLEMLIVILMTKSKSVEYVALLFFFYFKHLVQRRGEQHPVISLHIDSTMQYFPRRNIFAICMSQCSRDE